jgi:hypothetical protein
MRFRAPLPVRKRNTPSPRFEIIVLRRHPAGEEAAMAEKTIRCLVCAKPDPGEDTICPQCKALIRGEALERHREIRREADKALHKVGTEIVRKKAPARAA